ncbi:MAG: ATP-binding protein [Fimbriimonas sp.]
MLKIQKLKKTRINLRLALIGPTGSGKTYTGITLARTLTPGKILVIDSERSSADRYADIFNADERIDHLNLPDFNPDTYVSALELAASEGYPAVLIDSLSHAWMGKEGALEQVDKLAKRNGGGSSFNAWREVTPMHNRLVEAVLTYPGHVVATMRVKTEYVVEQVGGKSVPRKVGLSPVQRDGLEYEFDIVADMDQENNLIVTKTRMAALGGAVIPKPGPKLAEQIREWCENVPPTYRDVIARWAVSPEEWAEFRAFAERHGQKAGERLLEGFLAGKRDLQDVYAWIAEAWPIDAPVSAAKSETPDPYAETAPVQEPETPAAPPSLEASAPAVPAPAPTKSGEPNAFGLGTANWPTEAALTQAPVGDQPGLVTRNLASKGLPPEAGTAILNAFGIAPESHASRGGCALLLDWLSRADEDAIAAALEALKVPTQLAAGAAPGAS